MTDRIRRLLEGKQGNYILPFLWMHGEDEATLREYMGAIWNANIRAVCVESRPHPDFMGEKWWQDMDVVLDEARRRQMKVWILDDSHFPTGYANGALTHAEEELCRQSLVYRAISCPPSGERLTVTPDQYRRVEDWTPNLNESYTMDLESLRRYEDDAYLGAVALRLGGTSLEDLVELAPEEEDGCLRFAAPEGQWKLYILQLTRNRGPHRSYINMTDPASCRVLIDAVYEPHYARYGQDFGTTIAGFFSDEPELGNGHLYESGKRIYDLEDQAWSRETERALRERWQGDFLKYLPLLWEQDFSDSIKAKARYDYMDVVTCGVEEAFSRQIGDWCRAHGVEYIGHLIEDNGQHTRTASSLGHYFRGLAGQDMAGIDDIGGQVLPQGEWNGPYGLMGERRNGEFYHFVLGKLASSLAAIDPAKKNRAMCEIFGNYGWEEGVRLEKYLLDHFLVRGLNRFVPHAFSPRAYPDPDCPPHFYAHGHNPQYRHFGELMKYANRVCSLLDGGRNRAPVAILYNAEAEWTGDYMELERVARPLAESQTDYDFLPADVFSRREYFQTRIGGLLSVNGREYRILVIPRAQFLNSSVAEAMEEMRREGFPAVFLDAPPEGICGGAVLENGGGLPLPEAVKGAEVCPLEELPSMLERRRIPEITLEPPCREIRCLRYVAEREIYLFVNEGTKRYTGRIHVPCKGESYLYDAWENRPEAVASKEQGGGTWLSLEIEPGKSRIVVFDSPEGEVSRKREEQEGERIPWSDGWSRGICRSIDYPAFHSKKQVSLPDPVEAEYPEFSGVICYEKELLCEEVPRGVRLEITDAGEGVEVFVNDRSLGIQVVPPFRYDLTEGLRQGRNRVRVEAATTLERENAKTPDPIRSYLGLGEKTPVCPSGINGTAELIYER